FELQRSADGRNFSSLSFIATKALQGNSNTQLQYNYTDERPMKGSNYYRLKQQDRDGNISYSAVVSIKNAGANGITFIDVYPNPVKDNLKIKLASTTINKVDIVITDLAGRMVKQKSVQLIVGDNFIDMELTSMQAGQYLVKLVCSNGCEGAVTKIVKE
ncbi:MAG: T9SS type A sorting domain-containing protein, partial [Chitinophagaceae bacterium]